MAAKVSILDKLWRGFKAHRHPRWGKLPMNQNASQGDEHRPQVRIADCEGIGIKVASAMVVSYC